MRHTYTVSRPPTLAVLSPLLGDEFFGNVLLGIQRAARQADARAIAIQTWPQWRQGQEWLEGEEPTTFVPYALDHVDAVISLLRAAPLADLRRIHEAGTPVVTICTHYPDLGIPAVYPDNRAGVSALIHHLAEHGHTRIGFVGCMRNDDVLERHAAYEATLRALGIRPDPRLCFEATDMVESGGVPAAEALLAAGVPCTALFAATDENALTIMARVREAGVQVPRDLAVVGFDDVQRSASARPSLTTVHQPNADLGMAAARLALALLAGEDAPVPKVLVPSWPVYRQSCGCWSVSAAQPARRRRIRPATQAAVLRDAIMCELIGGAGPEAARNGARLAAGAEEVGRALSVVLEGGPLPGPGVLSAAWRAIGEEGSSLEALSRIFGAVERAVEAALRGRAPDQVTRARVRDLMEAMRTELLYAVRQPFITRATAFETINKLNYATSLELLAPRSGSVRDLHWLSQTLASAGCLGLWPGDEPGASLSVAGVYPIHTATSDADAGCTPAAFPPLDVFEDAMRAHPDHLLMVLPLQATDHDWGALALLSPPEVQVLTADAGVWQWTAPLMAALARERLLELYRQSERRGAQLTLERVRVEKEGFQAATSRLEELNRQLAETDRLTTALLEQTRARAAAAEELAQLRAAQATQAEALAAASAALAGALEPEQVYAAILEQAARVLPHDHAAVLLHQDGWVTMAGSRGVVTLPIGTRVFRLAEIADVTAHGMVGTPAVIPDTGALASWIAVPPFIGDHTIRSVLVVPLLVEGRVVGTFNVDSFTPNFYTEKHLPVAVAFAERVTLALHNARLFALERARARAAEELARMRSDFVAAVSHELRTPLTAIIGFGELLQARWEQFSDERRRERIGQIVAAANRQKRLVEDLLLVSGLETASLVSAPTPSRVSALVQPVIEEIQAGYPGQQVTTAGAADAEVWADPARVLQVLANLLDNAAKYSPEGSPIEVTWDMDGSLTTVRVRDHGPGIPETGRSEIFTRFGRVPGSRTRAGRVGTGLGLHLSRSLAEAMGGSLDLEETGPQGSTFRLQIPSAPRHRGTSPRVELPSSAAAARYRTSLGRSTPRRRSSIR